MRPMFPAIVLVALVPLAQAATHSQQQGALIELLRSKNITQLDEVPKSLSPAMLSNFMVKHGMDHDGPRGHKLEHDVPGFGIHAQPDKPRIYVYSPQTGTALSYNGDKSQQGGETLDIMTYEEATKSFDFQKLDFPIKNGQYNLSNNTCVSCHGGAGRNEKSRPIFSMYPDWPRFFGSDNDELMLAVKYPTAQSIPAGTDSVTRERIKMQQIEHDSFMKFKYVIAPSHPRYAPLFSEAAYRVHGFAEPSRNYTQYPYRSDVELIGERLNPSDVSRAFARRAGLRFNLLYSRLNVRQVMNTIVSQESRFEKFGTFFVYNTMRCGPEYSDNRVIRRWTPTILEALRKVEADKEIEYRVWDELRAASGEPVVSAGFFTLENGNLSLIGKKQALLHYGQNLALFGLKINDVDMRFTYYHPDYLPQNAYRSLKPHEVMQVGYLDICGDPNNGCEKYFNSYNDGSTTMDEHLTANILLELGKKNRAIGDFMRLKGAQTNRGLLNKYAGRTFENRLRLDRNFFTRMDSLSKWFSLPYPFVAGDEGKATKFIEMHHRAPFNATYRSNHKEMCGILERELMRAPL